MARDGKRRVSQRERQRRQKQRQRDTPVKPEDHFEQTLAEVRLRRLLGVPIQPLRPYAGLFDDSDW